MTDIEISLILLIAILEHRMDTGGTEYDRRNLATAKDALDQVWEMSNER